VTSNDLEHFYPRISAVFVVERCLSRWPSSVRPSVRPSIYTATRRCEQIPNISYRFQYAILL